MATIYMKTTAPDTTYRRYEGLTQSEIDTLLDNLSFTTYEVINEATYLANLPAV